MRLRNYCTLLRLIIALLRIIAPLLDEIAQGVVWDEHKGSERGAGERARALASKPSLNRGLLVGMAITRGDGDEHQLHACSGSEPTGYQLGSSAGCSVAP